MRILLASVAFAAACQPATAQETPEPKRPRRADPELMTRFHMYRQLDLSRAVERLIVRGKLAEARALAETMAEAPDPADIAPWAAEAAEVRDRARAIASARTLEEASRRSAELGAACASCHEKAGALVALETTPPLPLADTTVADRMARHLWAADRLWEGMIAYADVPWRAGLDVLAESDLPFSAFEGARQKHARQLRLLADRGRQRMTTDTLVERAQLYGEILATCVGCHANVPGTTNDVAKTAR